MPKSQQTEEVRILRFFEDAPIEKAEMLFNIVKEKMRTRSPTPLASHGRVGKKKEQSLGTTGKADERIVRGPPEGKLVP